MPGRMRGPDTPIMYQISHSQWREAQILGRTLLLVEILPDTFDLLGLEAHHRSHLVNGIVPVLGQPEQIHGAEIEPVEKLLLAHLRRVCLGRWRPLLDRLGNLEVFGKLEYLRLI